MTQKLINLVVALNLSPGIVLFIIVCMYLLLGCILDQIAILLLTIPLIFPLVMSLNFDPIWFGIIITKTAEIGMVTPPIGMNVYVTSASSGVKLEEVFRGIWPFVLADLIVLLILCMFPEISLWLPSLMGK